MEKLRNDWLDAPDLAAAQAVAKDIQRQAFIDLPMVPIGMYYQPTVYRKNVTGILAGFATFWNVQKS